MSGEVYVVIDRSEIVVGDEVQFSYHGRQRHGRIDRAPVFSDFFTLAFRQSESSRYTF